MDVLNRNVKFVISIYTRREYGGGSFDIIKNFRACTKNDYIENGVSFKSSEEWKEVLHGKICPDIDKKDDDYMVENTYSN